jgi:hypothetical protein
MTRSPRHVAPSLVLVTVLLSACLGGGSSASPAASSPSAPPASAPAEPSVAPSAEASAEDLGPFTCELPIHVDATVARANIVDVRVGTHDGYDRAVIAFSDGLPEVFVERASPPFVQDGSGNPIDVQGTSFLRVTLRGGTKQMDDGSSSYEGPRDFQTEFPMLVHFVEGGDFEAQSTWYVGLAAEACVRVLALGGDEPRLVIDVEH